MLHELIDLFQKKIKAAEEKYIHHFRGTVSANSLEGTLLWPGNEQLLREYVKGHYRHEALSDALKEVVQEKGTEIEQYFAHIDDLLNYYGAIKTEKKLADFLIKAHLENEEIMAGVDLSIEHQDFLKLGKALHDEAVERQQALKSAMRVLCELGAVEVADFLLKSRTFDSAKQRVTRKATQSSNYFTLLYRIADSLLDDFSDEFEIFYSTNASHKQRKNALDTIIEDCNEKDYPHYFLKMKIIVEVLWLKYEESAVEHLKQLASHLVHSEDTHEAKLKMVECCRVFYHHHNLDIANQALTSHYSNSFYAYYNAGDHAEQEKMLQKLAAEAGHYGKVTEKSEGFFEMLFNHHQEKPRDTMRLSNLGDQDDDEFAARKSKGYCSIQ